MKPQTYFCPFHNITYDLKNNTIFFWGGVFSQWAKTPIKDLYWNTSYSTAEQGMMYRKAMTFHDKEIADKILETSDPRQQKELGRQVKNYDDLVWKERRLEIVTQINYWKFSQNRELKSIIVGLKDWEFVEASPVDKIWGVGMSVDDDRIFDPSNWQGENLLGQAIKEAQIRIINEL